MNGAHELADYHRHHEEIWPERPISEPGLRRNLRQRQAVTTLKLAQALGSSRQALISWELGDRAPTDGNGYHEAIRHLLADAYADTLL